MPDRERPINVLIVDDQPIFVDDFRFGLEHMALAQPVSDVNSKPLRRRVLDLEEVLEGLHPQEVREEVVGGGGRAKWTQQRRRRS